MSMPIDEVISYHQNAVKYLTTQIDHVPKKNEERRAALGLALDFHNRAIVTLVAAKQLFESLPEQTEKINDCCPTTQTEPQES